MPVVRPTRRQGLFALPGLAKLGSSGFSFGRVGMACMVGCAVVATVPVMDGTASGDPAPAAKARTKHVLVSEGFTHQEQTRPVKVTKDKERKGSSKGSKPAHQTKPTKDDSYGSPGASLLPVDLPPVDLPPVDLPPVELPLPPVEVPPPPQLPGVPTLPPLSSLTS